MNAVSLTPQAIRFDVAHLWLHAGFLLFVPYVFLLSIVVGKSFVDNECHVLDKDAIFRYLHHKNGKVRDCTLFTS